MEVAIFANGIPQEYKPMLDLINTKLGPMMELSNNFYKTQSQFMDSTLTVAQPTPIRSLRQILSEIERIEAALKEHHFKREKIKVEIDIRTASAQQKLSIFQNRMRIIEIEELRSKLVDNEKYGAATIRRLTAYIEQFESIAKKYNIQNFTEADFEAQEEEYHIKTAFNQAITAARARGGLIDEGNHIYLQQLGISGHDAQKDVTALFENEKGSIGTPQMNYKLVTDFLETVYQKYKGNAYKHMENRGLIPVSKVALLGAGNKKIE